MLNLLEKPTANVQVDLRNPLVCDGVASSIKHGRVQGDELNALESQCWTELKGLREELNELLFELSLKLTSYRRL